jgi:ketosteroid isomerase-like protein
MAAITFNVFGCANASRALGEPSGTPVASSHRDDGIELPPHHPLVRGRTAIEQRYRALFKEATVTGFTFTHLETTIDGNVAYDAGTYEQRLTLPSGQVLNDTGKYLAILKRSEREWKAAYTTYNSDLPATPCRPRE